MLSHFRLNAQGDVLIFLCVYQAVLKSEQEMSLPLWDTPLLVE